MGELTMRDKEFEAKYEPPCRLYVRDEDGFLRDLCLEFGLEQLGGVIPQPGDCIVDPSVPVGLDSDEPSNRTVYEVVRRYLKPANPNIPRYESVENFNWIILEVVARPGDESEDEPLAHNIP